LVIVGVCVGELPQVIEGVSVLVLVLVAVRVLVGELVLLLVGV